MLTQSNTQYNNKMNGMELCLATLINKMESKIKKIKTKTL